LIGGLGLSVAPVLATLVGGQYDGHPVPWSLIACGLGLVGWGLLRAVARHHAAAEPTARDDLARA
jgi:hypothetical protein